MMRTYEYHTCCIHSTFELITQMTDTARQITYATFMRHVALPDVLAVLPGYETDARHGLTLKKDWHIRYYKSVYNGVPCYYLDHSRIEYIFLRSIADTESNTP